MEAGDAVAHHPADRERRARPRDLGDARERRRPARDQRERPLGRRTACDVAELLTQAQRLREPRSRERGLLRRDGQGAELVE